jgi:hypothetical protein
MSSKRIATTALDWGVLASKIPAENKVCKGNSNMYLYHTIISTYLKNGTD